MKSIRIIFFQIIYLTFIIFFSSKSIAQTNSEDLITFENYKENIVRQYYLYQETEKKVYLDNIFKFIRLKEVNIKEDSIISKVLYLKAVNEVVYLQRYNKAKNYLLQSLKLAEKTNDYYLIGSVYNLMGMGVSMIEENYIESDSLYREAIIYYKKTGNFSHLVDTYYNLTVNSRYIRDWNLSLSYSKSFLETLEKSEKKIENYSRIYYYIADNHIQLQNFKEAINTLNLFEKYETSADDYTKSLINKIYANYYEYKKEFQLAAEHYKLSNVNFENTYKIKVNSLKKSFVDKLELENELVLLKNSTIKNQNKILLIRTIIILILIILVVVLIWFFIIIRKRNKQIKVLNSELSMLVLDLKGKNKDLLEKRREVENLLTLNEQSLFSKVLRVSTYNDAIRKISEDIDTYTLSNPSSSNYLFTLNKKLLALISEEELWEDFKIQFEKIRPDFFNKLKKVAPSLSVNDLKHCTYIISNLKSKEVAQLINLSPRSVETTRYRIKKKLGLERDDNLYDLLSKL